MRRGVFDGCRRWRRRWGVAGFQHRATECSATVVEFSELDGSVMACRVGRGVFDGCWRWRSCWVVAAFSHRAAECSATVVEFSELDALGLVRHGRDVCGDQSDLTSVGSFPLTPPG
jgi:hypothetical protein